MLEILGDRRIVLSRELTKKYEEFIRGSLSEALEWTQTDEIRGEFCLVVEGAGDLTEDDGEPWWEHLTAEEHVNHYISSQGMASKEAIKQTAKDRGLPKRDIYQQFHIKN